MSLWRWLVDLFKSRPVERVDEHERHVLDAAAANAAKAAESGVSSPPGVTGP